MKKLAVIFTGTLFTFLSLSAYAGTETLRDSSGKTIGYIITESNGRIVYRDSSNRQVGRADPDGKGKYRYYDGSGRSIGTSQVNGSKTEYRDGSNRHIKDITSSSSEKKVFVKDGKIQFFK